MLRYLIKKQRGDQQQGPSTSAADSQRSDATVAAETPEIQNQQPIVEVRNQVDDDNYGDDSEVLEVCHDQQPVPEVLQQVDDEGRQPNSTPNKSRNNRSDAVKRKYEKTKRRRKFSQSWKKSFPWITLKNGKMFCSTCLENNSLCDKQSKFVKDGCENFHIKALQTHGASEAHKKCAAHENAARATPGTNPAERALQVMNQESFNKMRILFRISHSIAKKGRPFSDYAWSTDLHEVTHGVSLGKTYRNDKASWQDIQQISCFTEHTSSKC